MASSPRLPLVLASASPRRRDLLARAGVPVEVRPADVPEERDPDETPEAFASRLARAKASAVAERVGAPPARLVLGADTIVVLGEAVLGKPRDPGHAEELLRALLGREHRVLTAVALVDTGTRRVRHALVASTVRMREAPSAEVRRYVATGEPLDKAGAYAVQGEGRRFVECVTGSESNVIGLPLDETLALLREAGFPPGRAAAL